MFEGLAGNVERNEGDNLNGLMRSNAEGAVGVGMPGWVAVRHLHDSDHQHQRDAEAPDENYPGRPRVQL